MARELIVPCEMDRQIHVLLADDENDFRFSAAIALRRAGYRVTVAINGLEAFARVLEAASFGDPVNLLVTDEQMPAMTGGELVAALRAQGFYLPVVVITAHRDGSPASTANPGCVSEFLEKPLSPEDLVACLARVTADPKTATRSA